MRCCNWKPKQKSFWLFLGVAVMASTLLAGAAGDEEALTVQQTMMDEEKDLKLENMACDMDDEVRHQEGCCPCDQLHHGDNEEEDDR